MDLKKKMFITLYIIIIIFIIYDQQQADKSPTHISGP